MIVRIHKIHWSKEASGLDNDLDFEITDTDCYVTKTSHPCARWAVEQNEAWCRVSSWFQRKHAVVTLGEPQEIK